MTLDDLFVMRIARKWLFSKCLVKVLPTWLFQVRFGDQSISRETSWFGEVYRIITYYKFVCIPNCGKDIFDLVLATSFPNPGFLADVKLLNNSMRVVWKRFVLPSLWLISFNSCWKRL